jgi:hypothetical protein
MTTHGQINETTKRWELLQEIIKNNNFKSIVEIGTWKGMGSTLAVLKSKQDNTKFISLESNIDFFSIAEKNLNSFKNEFELLFGRIVEIDEVLSYVSEFSLSSEQNQWLSEDIQNFKNCPNVLDKLPEKIDLLILDGGEFSTYIEWNKLKDRVSFIVLDDIYVLKCNKIYNELLGDDSYVLIDKTDEGNGFCIFKKK